MTTKQTIRTVLELAMVYQLPPNMSIVALPVSRRDARKASTTSRILLPPPLRKAHTGPSLMFSSSVLHHQRRFFCPSIFVCQLPGKVELVLHNVAFISKDPSRANSASPARHVRGGSML